MKTNHSGAKYSAIVGISEKLAKLERETDAKFLKLNRGIPVVTNIDLSEIIPLIDFNSPQIQIYPPNSGQVALKEAINKYYFQNETLVDNIFITAGGINALDLVFQTLNIDKILLPEFYWGAYANIMKINNIEGGTYFSFDELKSNAPSLTGSAVIICDPNNPVGNKYDDAMLLDVIKVLNDNNVVVIWDSPYRRIFFEASEDDFYVRLASFDNVVITDSFSKAIGLSGQRLGFVHSNNKEFKEELNINILFKTNGINAFAQTLVTKILTTEVGQKAAHDFREKTKVDMLKNIQLLRDKKLLAEEFYDNSIPVGIFVILNKNEKELLDANIGSVSMSYFTQKSKEYGEKFSRICIAVPHGEFKEYFDRL
ncbi:MAG: hypothetical protein B6I18_05365 [Bacteroidetes bacterium 4572_112]|nr:MAG: hypothetical protein B6I18_05365 [Bacteroidetes bacterium 4572_112]